MNPVFIMVKDMPKVRAAIIFQKLEAVKKANTSIIEWLSVVMQNIGFYEDATESAANAKADALSAAEELVRAAKDVLRKVKDLDDDGYQ